MEDFFSMLLMIFTIVFYVTCFVFIIMVPIHLSRLNNHIHINNKQLRRIARHLESKEQVDEDEE